MHKLHEAHDSVKRDKIITIQEQLNIDSKDLRIIKTRYW